MFVRLNVFVVSAGECVKGTPSPRDSIYTICAFVCVCVCVCTCLSVCVRDGDQILPE